MSRGRFAAEWRRRGAAYVLFLLLFAALNSGISYFLIWNGNLAFPVRPFPELLKNNFLYDWMFLPLFGLLLTRLAYKHHRPWAFTLIFASTVAIIDWPLEALTQLLDFHNWNLAYTFLSAVAIFIIKIWVYHRLVIEHGDDIQSWYKAKKQPS